MRLPGTAAMIAAIILAATAAAARAEPTLAEEAAFRAAVARIAAAVVRIELLALSTTAGGSAEAAAGTGPSTGTAVAAGLVLTTAFAIPADVNEAVVVLPDGARRAARVRARDNARGLVALAVEGLPEPPPLEAVPRESLRPGQWAIGVGRGWSASAPSVAVGIVSATSRAWGRGVQTDAAVSPVNYGGPLVDIAGRVIGILAPLPADTAGLTEGTELYDAGIGFAVPLDDVLAVLPRLARGESLEPGTLGIGYRSRDPINGEPVIASVRQGSPAARAGLAPGDRIVAIDGRPVTRIADARHAIGPKRAGDELAVSVERRRAADPPTRVEARAVLVAELPPWRRTVIGILASSAADGDERGPLRVGWLLPGGPAEKAGLAVGDVIEAIADGREGGATPLDGRGSAAGVLAGVEPGTPVTLSVRRDGVVREIVVETAAMPGDVPADGPPVEAAGDDPLAGPLDAVEVVRLAGADVTDPALAVVPRGAGPVGALVWTGSPQGKLAEDEAAIWKAAAARHGVAVILPGSIDPAAWSRDDLPGVVRALAALAARRPIDPARIAVAGAGGGAAFAWVAGERLGGTAGGVAVVGTALPRRADVKRAEPGGGRWVLLGPGGDEATRQRVEADRLRLDEAGYPTGVLEEGTADAPPIELLCRWVAMLGLL